VRRAARARWRDARGQATAFVLSLLFLLILFVAVVATVGQAVNRRIALQIVADAGAYSGATVMAAGMNQLAYWNRQIQRSWALVALTSNWLPPFIPFTFGGCVAGNTAVASYAAVQAAYAGAYVRMSGEVNNRAARVSAMNAADLFPGERLGYAESDASPEVLIPLPGRIPGPVPIATLPVRRGTRPIIGRHAWAPETPWDFLPVHLLTFLPFYPPPYRPGITPWPCYVEGTILPPQFSTVSFWSQSPWWRLQRIGRPYYFIWRVESPPARALMFDRFFGPNAIPAMKAVAVAQPVGGDIQQGRSEYRVQMVPVSRVSLGGFIFDNLYDRRIRRVTH
jgi:hypothetical protein